MGDTAVRTVQPCGTNAAYHRHRYRGEVPCDDCRAAATAYERSRRRASGVTPRTVQPCGTHAAYFRHMYLGEVPCAACRKAHSVAVVESRRARRRARRRGTLKDVIVDYLETHGAVTLQELIWLIRRRHTDINESSLRRTVLRLTDEGVVERYESWDGATLYEAAL